MVGLMLKDFYESFCIKKNLIGFICSILLYGMVFFLMPSEYIVILLVVLTIPMTSVSPLQYSIEQDELSKFDQMLLTYPISKKNNCDDQNIRNIYLFICIFLITFFTCCIVSYLRVSYYQFTRRIVSFIDKCDFYIDYVTYK